MLVNLGNILIVFNFFEAPFTKYEKVKFTSLLRIFHFHNIFRSLNFDRYITNTSLNLNDDLYYVTCLEVILDFARVPNNNL